MSTWYAIKTKKKNVWTIGTFKNMISDYYGNPDYVVLGPFSSSKKAELDVEAFDGKLKQIKKENRND